MATPLPAHPDLDWLKKTAKQRLKVLRATSQDARLNEAQLLLAREHGFTSWRALKAHVEDLAPSRTDRRGVFKAARSGDIDSVRRALAAGFDPYLTDDDGRTLHQIAKEQRLDDIEILVRDLQARKLHPQQTTEAIEAICAAASQGDVATLRALLDAHPALIDALGGDFHKYTALHRATCRNQHDALRLLIGDQFGPLMCPVKNVTSSSSPRSTAASHTRPRSRRQSGEIASCDGIQSSHNRNSRTQSIPSPAITSNSSPTSPASKSDHHDIALLRGQ